LTQYDSNEVLKNHCLSKRKLCIIGFLDGRPKNKEFFDENVKTMNTLLEKTTGKPFSFSWVNATCYVSFI